MVDVFHPPPGGDVRTSIPQHIAKRHNMWCASCSLYRRQYVCWSQQALGKRKGKKWRRWRGVPFRRRLFSPPSWRTV